MKPVYLIIKNFFMLAMMKMLRYSVVHPLKSWTIIFLNAYFQQIDGSSESQKMKKHTFWLHNKQ